MSAGFQVTQIPATAELLVVRNDRGWCCCLVGRFCAGASIPDAHVHDTTVYLRPWVTLRLLAVRTARALTTYVIRTVGMCRQGGDQPTRNVLQSQTVVAVLQIAGRSTRSTIFTAFVWLGESRPGYGYTSSSFAALAGFTLRVVRHLPCVATFVPARTYLGAAGAACATAFLPTFTGWL